jgi:hypothetical protein
MGFSCRVCHPLLRLTILLEVAGLEGEMQQADGGRYDTSDAHQQMARLE